MKLSSVFSKTPKGVDEISTRANRLNSRQRALLILVDGQRTGNDLLALSGAGSEGRRQLAALLDAGLVEIRTASVSGSVEEIAGPARPDEDISLAKSYATRTLQELLGAEAAALVAEIEKAETPDELQKHFGKLRSALRAAPDQKRAKQFLEKLALVLD